MLLCHATTGGTDTMAALIHTKLRHYSINQILQVLAEPLPQEETSRG